MMKQNRPVSSTKALLDKVNCQLKGERVRATAETDDLKTYINQLTTKTLQHQKSLSFDDDSEISISKRQRKTRVSKSPPPPMVSKFLKKKTPATQDSINVPTARNDSPVVKPVILPLQPHQSRQHFFPCKPSTTTFQRSLSNITLSDNETETSVGVSAGANPNIDPVVQLSSSLTSNEIEKQINFESKFLSIKPDMNSQTHKTNLPHHEEHHVRSSQPERFVSVALSSDEESLADFIANLSETRPTGNESDRLERTTRPTTPDTHDFKGKIMLDFGNLDSPSFEEKHPKNTTSQECQPDIQPASVENLNASQKNVFYPGNRHRENERKMDDPGSVFHSKNKSPFYRNTRSDSPRSNPDIRGSNADPGLKTKSILTYKTENGVFKKSSATKNIQNTFNFKPGNKVPKEFSTEAQDHALKNNDDGKWTDGNIRQNDRQKAFGVFGLQTVDDLLPARSHFYDEEISMSKPATSKDSITSLSEHLASSKKHATNHRDDINTETRSISSEEDSNSQAVSKTTTESHVTTKKLEVSETKITIATRTMEVQTEAEGGVQYMWDPRFSHFTMSPPLGLSSVNPQPIATHVVSADAIEVMSAYTPATIALHNLLKEQLHLTTQFLNAQASLYMNYNRVPDYSYTTLEETKKYIEENKKPKLTFEEALKIVSAEAL